MADSGYLRVEGTNLCYTDGFSNKYTISHDTGYSSVVGVDKKGYFWIDENDLLRIYYIDENGVKRRTDVAESLGNVGSDSKGYMWVGNDSYLYFIGPSGGKMRINGTVTPIPTTNDYLGFAANISNSTIALNIYNPRQQTPVSLEYSMDKSTWTDYTWTIDGDNFNGSIITLPSVGSKVYWRNKSETPVKFSTSTDHYYNFAMTGSIAASGDTGYLFCKDSTTSFPSTQSGCHFCRLFRDCASLTTPPKLPITYIDQYSYSGMFRGCSNLTIAPELPGTTVLNGGYVSMFSGCSSLITPPKLPATDLWQDCYAGMFRYCTSLSSLPSLPCTSIPRWSYRYMFGGCSNIKLSETQTGIYQTAYRIPTDGTGSIGTDSLLNMFEDTGGTFTGTPNINQTYYTSNTII